MEFQCEDCAFFKKCIKDKNEACSEFIFKRRVTDKPVTIKTNRIKKG